MNGKFRTLSFKIFVVVSIIACMVVASAYTPETPAVATEKIKEALIGAKETMLSVGKFESLDGLTSSLSKEEVSNLIRDFNSKVDLYYSSENPVNASYKQINEELLSDTFLTEVDYTVDCGVLSYELLNIEFNDSYSEATVEAALVCWSKWIDEEGGLYRICSPVNRNIITAKMVLEDGNWKVLEYVNVQKEFGDLQEGVESSKETNVLSQTQNNLQNEIIQVEELTGTYSYRTFEEASSSANIIDGAKINPFE